MKTKYVKIYSTAILIGIFTFLASSSGENSSNGSNEDQDLDEYYKNFDLKESTEKDINNIIDVFGKDGKITSRASAKYGQGGVYDYKEVECFAEIEIFKNGKFIYKTSSRSEKEGKWSIADKAYDLKMPQDYCCSETNFITLKFQLDGQVDKALLIIDDKYGPMLCCSDNEYSFNSSNNEPELRDLVNSNIFFVP